MMDWAMADERLKVELFRFVDVFPTLDGGAEIARHLREYFLQAGVAPPRALRLAIGATGRRSPLRPAAARVVRAEMLSFARRFIVGSDARSALPGLRALRDRGLGFTIDVLGEASVSAREAAAYQQRYLDLLDDLTRETQAWPEAPAVDRAAWGALPRVNVSIKITSLYSQIDPLDFRGSVEAVKDALRPVVRPRPRSAAPSSTSTSSSSATATSPSPSSPSCSTKRSSAPSTRPAWSCRPTCATRATTCEALSPGGAAAAGR